MFAVFYRYADKLMTASLKRKEKNTNTSYYFSLEPYGLDDDEVELEHDKTKQPSLFLRLRKEKTIAKSKFAFDRNDRASDLDREAHRINNNKDADAQKQE